MTWDKMSDTEKNILVAKEIMGLVPCDDPVGRCEGAKHDPPLCWGTGEAGSDLLPYTTDISAAWQVVEKMRSKYLEFYMNTLGSDLWECEVEIGEGDNFIVVNAKSQNPCEAICCCALRAEGVEI